MKNNLKLIVLFIMTLFIISYSSSLAEITEKNIKDKFYLGEKLTGTIVLKIQNEKADSNISINYEEPIKIVSLLKQGSIPYSCNPYDCSPRYSSSNPSLLKQIQISPQESILGIKVMGSKIRITDIKLNLSSDFNEEENIPLKIDFFRRVNWVYKEPSTNYNPPIWGCYDTTIPSSGIGISPHEKFQISSSSRYCEKFFLPESGYIQTGASIESSASNELKMSVYDANAPSIELSSCTFSPETGFCNMKRDNWFQSGEFYLCLGLKDPSSQLNGVINIFKENYGNTCGWYVPQGYGLEQMIQSPSSIDYSIFVKTGKYASAKPVIIDNLEIPQLVENSNTYLNLTYKNICNSGCILPLFIQGVNQNMNISLIITYEIVSGSGGITSNNYIYDLITEPAELNFFGSIDLSKTNTTLNTRGNTSIKIKFNNQQILDNPITVFSESSIDGLYPLNPPAGLTTNFTLNIRSDAGISKIIWDFGDNTTLQTSVTNAEHTYSNIGNYLLKIYLTDKNGVTLSREFQISVTSPSIFIEEDLRKKYQRLDNLTKSIANLPIWYQGKIKEKVNFSYYESEIREMNILKATTASDQQLVELFIRLQNLFVPSYVFISEESISPNLIKKEEVNPEIISNYLNEIIDLERLEDYKNSIINWQNQNINTTIKRTIVSYFTGKDEIKPALGIYSLELFSNQSDDLYMVINQKLENLEFRTNENPIRINESVLLSFVRSRQIDLFDLQGENLTFFISPKLSSLEIIEYIQKCNFNGICEKNQGETISGCRSDCKPTGIAMFYIILLVIGLFIVYSFLAWWYKYYYEKRLFKDRKQVYNIVMFILNSRVNGMSEWKISELLKQQNWNSEQISYGFRRADGKRVGFPEIIPIERLKLLIRKIKVKTDSLTKPKQLIVKW